MYLCLSSIKTYAYIILQQTSRLALPRVSAIPGKLPGKTHESEVAASQRSASDLKFLIAAISASAGGVKAYTELIRHLAPDTGMGFVLIQHLDPNHHSILTELFARETAMPVKEVTNGVVLRANHINFRGERILVNAVCPVT